jgi:hypothetical protein
VEAVGVLLGSLFEPFVLFTILLVPLEEDEEEEGEDEEEDNTKTHLFPLYFSSCLKEVTNCDDLSKESKSYNGCMSILFSAS